MRAAAALVVLALLATSLPAAAVDEPIAVAGLGGVNLGCLGAALFVEGVRVGSSWALTLQASTVWVPDCPGFGAGLVYTGAWDPFLPGAQCLHDALAHRVCFELLEPPAGPGTFGRYRIEGCSVVPCGISPADWDWHGIIRLTFA